MIAIGLRKLRVAGLRSSRLSHFWSGVCLSISIHLSLFPRPFFADRELTSMNGTFGVSEYPWELLHEDCFTHAPISLGRSLDTYACSSRDPFGIFLKTTWTPSPRHRGAGIKAFRDHIL
ncbi:hypothetical protein ACTXT7_017629, partial [Hymenolepis weldensis]